MDPALEIWTIGHSTRPIAEFVALLDAWRIGLLADVRTVPRSRRHPAYNTESLAEALPGVGVAYAHLPALGGFRRPWPDSPNGAWRNASFRGYADYMLTPEFEEALGRLIDLATRWHVAIMCAEAVPWRCHRSLIADALVVRGHHVRHITSASSAAAHRLTPFAVVEGGRVTYPAPI